jgi:hypothetical protein
MPDKFNWKLAFVDFSQHLPDTTFEPPLTSKQQKIQTLATQHASNHQHQISLSAQASVAWLMPASILP